MNLSSFIVRIIAFTSYINLNIKSFFFSHCHRRLSWEGYASCLTALVANKKMKIQAQMASFVVLWVVGQNAEFFKHEHSIPKIKIKPSI